MNQGSIPYFEDEDSKRQPNFPTVERATINAVLWNSRTDEFLCLDWVKFGWRTFVIGGVEAGEDVLAAALRELAEETGYADVEFVADLGKLRSGYFAAHKKENRIAHTTGLLFKLTNYARSAVENANSLPHIFKWIPRSEVATFLTLSSQKYLWEKAQMYLV